MALAQCDRWPRSARLARGSDTGMQQMAPRAAADAERDAAGGTTEEEWRVPDEACGRCKPKNIARAIPGANLVVMSDCGHFAYLECADDVRNAFKDFLRR